MRCLRIGPVFPNGEETTAISFKTRLSAVQWAMLTHHVLHLLSGKKHLALPTGPTAEGLSSYSSHLFPLEVAGGGRSPHQVYGNQAQGTPSSLAEVPLYDLPMYHIPFNSSCSRNSTMTCQV